MKKLRLACVVGARPNFMKMAPLLRALEPYPGVQLTLIHTGQHYDKNLSDIFFEQLDMRRPDVSLEVGSGSHAVQTAQVLERFEGVLVEAAGQGRPFDRVVVVGDVNSTMACTITAKKLGIQVAHVEAGLRSRDMSMPEEINRLCTDVLCDYLFTTDHFADENLAAEGVSADKIFFVGNVMIDTLLKHRALAATLDLSRKLGLMPQGYATLTMHRPGNVDDKRVLTGILEALAEIAKELTIVFPIHPRTKKMAEQFGLGHFFNSGAKVEGIWITEPLGYLEFLHLNMNAKLVLTDSGGLQEETTVLGVPCITMRPNTERPITCEVGSNIMVGNDKTRILEEARKILNGEIPRGRSPEKWDGHAAERIVDVLVQKLG
ncbi:MAG: UDP-N-acetylglucosamine 2-epimerase (non-hydrolyzing) [Sedimentisphaerales bacterium]|nr:UDP-N-acetylglucosamine 2-epimerase (non-hydrolyzing) [Sedimentisphaerales bacterium]